MWLFSRDGEHGVGDWLPVLREGGARALKQLLRDHGSSSHDTKLAYLAQVQRFFEVGRNAFALLNQAAGLKQLNSIDQLFRELVLEDKPAYKRAEEVVASFDMLTDLHRDLEIVRGQQRSLLPIEAEEQIRRRQVAEVESLSNLQRILPIWFATHACCLWQQRHTEFSAEVAALQDRTLALEQQEQQLQEQVDDLYRIYIEAGGGNLRTARTAHRQSVRASFESARIRSLTTSGWPPGRAWTLSSARPSYAAIRKMPDGCAPSKGPLLEQLEQCRAEQSGAALNTRNSARDLE